MIKRTKAILWRNIFRIPTIETTWIFARSASMACRSEKSRKIFVCLLEAEKNVCINYSGWWLCWDCVTIKLLFHLIIISGRACLLKYLMTSFKASSTGDAYLARLWHIRWYHRYCEKYVTISWEAPHAKHALHTHIQFAQINILQIIDAELRVMALFITRCLHENVRENAQSLIDEQEHWNQNKSNQLFFAAQTWQKVIALDASLSHFSLNIRLFFARLIIVKLFNDKSHIIYCFFQLRHGIEGIERALYMKRANGKKWTKKKTFLMVHPSYRDSIML